MYTINECMSIRSWVNLQIGDEFPASTLCLYQGKPLLRTQWDITLICADVVFMPLPLGGGGGGKNILAAIGMLVVAMSAIVLQQYYILPAMISAFGTTLGPAVAYGITTAVMMAGSMLMNAVFPTQMPKTNFNTEALESASPTFSTSISQNAARLWQLIPRTYGTHEIVPDLAANYFSEFQGNEQYLWEWLSDGRDMDATAVIYGKEDPGLQCIILSVKPRQNGICDIEAVVEDERVHADPGPAPVWTPGRKVPVASMSPVITGLTATYNPSTETLALSWISGAFFAVRPAWTSIISIPSISSACC